MIIESFVPDPEKEHIAKKAYTFSSIDRNDKPVSKTAVEMHGDFKKAMYMTNREKQLASTQRDTTIMSMTNKNSLSTRRRMPEFNFD